MIPQSEPGFESGNGELAGIVETSHGFLITRVNGQSTFRAGTLIRQEYKHEIEASNAHAHNDIEIDTTPQTYRTVWAFRLFAWRVYVPLRSTRCEADEEFNCLRKLSQESGPTAGFLDEISASRDDANTKLTGASKSLTELMRIQPAFNFSYPRFLFR